MAAAARYGTATFYGLQSKQNQSVDIYISDVANAQVNFDSGNGASSSSLTFWRAPEDCVLVDISLATGLTDTTNIVATSDGRQLEGARYRYANHINTLTTRSSISKGFKRGSSVGFIQVA